MSYMELKSISRRYGRGETRVEAVAGVDLRVGQGDFLSVMGPSGSGKSTILSILGGLNTPTSGSYTVDGMKIYNLTGEQRADFRREYLGFIFQNFHLLPYLSLAENASLPLAIQRLSRKEKQEMALEALDRVGLADKAARLPGQISGGEQERTAIARAVVNEPQILLADEPTGNLDSRTSAEIMDLLGRLNGQGMTIVMVTHSREAAARADSVVEVRDGRIVGSGRKARFRPAEEDYEPGPVRVRAQG